MNLKDECFLITGAAGFVGSCLTRRLVKMGCKVHAFVPLEGDLWRIKDLLPSLSLHRGDITDETFIQNLITQISPSIIYHLAVHGAYSSQGDAKRILMTNVLGTWNLLGALEKKSYKLFVNTGSSSEYGFKQKPMQENDLTEPNSYYAVAKTAQTMLCQYTAKSQTKPIVTFRLFSVYGPYEEPSRLVPTIIRRCLQGEPLEMANPLTARDFIFVEDVVEAFLNVQGLLGLSGEILNIGTGRQTTLKEIASTVLDVAGSSVDVHWHAIDDRCWDTSIWVGDVDNVQKILGWQAKTSLRDGLNQTMEWIKKI